MTHDELLEEITAYERRTCNSARDDSTCISLHPLARSLRAVVELHYPIIHALPDETCRACQDLYPCPTIQAIEKELGNG